MQYSSLPLSSPLWKLTCHMGAHNVTATPQRWHSCSDAVVWVAGRASGL